LKLIDFLYISGRGVFATESIEQGQFICEYFGELLSGQEGELREAAEPSCFRYFFHYKGKEYWYACLIIWLLWYSIIVYEII